MEVMASMTLKLVVLFLPCQVVLQVLSADLSPVHLLVALLHQVLLLVDLLVLHRLHQRPPRIATLLGPRLVSVKIRHRLDDFLASLATALVLICPLRHGILRSH